MRHSIGRILFLEIIAEDKGQAVSVQFARRLARRQMILNGVILLLIIGSYILLIEYIYTLGLSIGSWWNTDQPNNDEIERALRGLNLFIIPYRARLLATYTFSFVFAETGFILMATKEYIQDIVRVSDIRIIETGVTLPKVAPAVEPP